MGNLWSVQSAFMYLGTTPIISSNPIEIEKADILVLPGVGSFNRAAKILSETGIDKAISKNIHKNNGKILGICLGMQLLCLSSHEDGFSKGLEIIPTTVEQISSGDSNLKIPHIGFNFVECPENSVLFKGLKPNTDFYFVHSYKLKYKDIPGKIGITTYGDRFISSFESSNIFATQFHPEKSQTNGLKILQNFLNA